MSSVTTTTLTRDGSTAWIRLEGEGQLNAIGSATYRSIASQLAEAEADESTRVVVIHGAGKAFSAGADIAEISSFGHAREFETFIHGFTDALDTIASSPLPVIAAVHGVAFGGGLELAMACDLRIVTRTARLGLPEAKLGVLPGAGGTQRLPRLIPAGIATEMLMLGNHLDAPRAYELGLVNRLTDEDSLLQEAAALAAEMATGAPRVFSATKSLLRVTRTTSIETGITHEREAATALFDSADGREGFAAFTQRRPPEFTGA